jgi:hypothetical protein
VLAAQVGGCSGLGVLRRAGLATWMREVANSGQSQVARCDNASSDPVNTPPAAVHNALAGLMAGLVIAHAKETALA